MLTAQKASRVLGCFKRSADKQGEEGDSAALLCPTLKNLIVAFHCFKEDYKKDGDDPFRKAC